MEKKQSEFNKVFSAWDILVIAFGAMIGWGWVVSSGGWIQKGGVLGAALALLLAVCLLFGSVLGLLLLLGLARVTVLQGGKVRVKRRFSVLQVHDRAAQRLHQVAVMGDEQQCAGVGRQRLGQALAHVDVQVVRRLDNDAQSLKTSSPR